MALLWYFPFLMIFLSSAALFAAQAAADDDDDGPSAFDSILSINQRGTNCNYYFLFSV